LDSTSEGPHGEAGDRGDSPRSIAPAAFLIAGVGASAGGLAPTGELLRELGEDPGIAVVIVHHLDPTHESGLVEVLARASKMPVAVARDGTPVESNHVYFVPPNAGLLIQRGVLKIVPGQAEPHLHLPIDQFFESLGLDREGLSAGVVLSGSGFDGTEGIKAIKREGGIALAQDATAQFGDMPRSAIATGFVDFVLPPAGLARELRRIGARARAAPATVRSTNEELQAANQELRTVNDELRERNIEATRLSHDLTNVVSSTEIPMLIVGRDLRLQRFTPAAGSVFGVLATDLGRPMSDIAQLGALAPALTPVVKEVLERLLPSDCTVQDAVGRWYHVSVRPFLTLDGRIDGTVIFARDIDAEKRAAERIAAAQRYAEGIVETIRDGLVVLERDLVVSSANAAFRRAFRLEPEEIQGRRLDQLGRPELSTPALQTLLEGLSHGAATEDLRLGHQDSAGVSRVFLLHARRVARTDRILLAFQDITEAERTRRASTELSFHDALTSAAEGILMVDPTGRVLFANPAAARLFGYESEEMSGISIDELVPGRLRDVHAGHRADYLASPSARPMGRHREVTGRRKGGAEFPIEVTLSTMKRDDGPVVVAFVTDVTERRVAEHQLRRYQARLRHMTFDAVLTEERERRRIAIELHDGIGQTLALAQIKLSSVRENLVGAPREVVEGVVKLLEQAIGDQRSLIFELSPPVLYDLGLKEALAWLAEDIQKRHGMRFEVADDGTEKPLDDAAKAVVFRTIRELVMNVLKHANAPAAKASLRRIDDHLEVLVEDRGVGFDAKAPMDRPSAGGFGLFSVREQITGLGGTLNIDSAPEQGTRVRVRVPLRPSTPEGQPGAGAQPGREAAS
jgi:PAS domain S-box-containing protein